MNTSLRSASYPNQVEVQLIQGDITDCRVEGIVNPANSQLMHGGGLAGLLSRKAGPALQAESAAWIAEHGPVSHDSPAFTSGGELPFKNIIHAVGPVWGSGEEQSKLRAAVLGSLERADQLNLTSLAVPAISTGIFGYPRQEAALVILNSVLEYVRDRTQGSLRDIQVVVFDDPAAETFSQVWDRVFS